MALRDCNRAILESALASPRASFGRLERYPNLPSKAAALTYALAKSQACIDGNKRIAFLLLNEFLAINGAGLEMQDEEAIAMILDTARSDPADRDMTIMNLTTRLEATIADLPDDEEL